VLTTGLTIELVAQEKHYCKPSCAGKWKFKGHVVTDCFALKDIWSRHKTLANSVQVAAAAIKAGVSLDCSNLLQDDVMKAVDQKLLTEKEIDNSLSGILSTQVKLGFFDDPSVSPYLSYKEDSIAMITTNY
jgi:beta-glucosidase